MLVAIAPRAPVDSTRPGIFETWGFREDVPETGREDDFSRGVGLACGVGGEEGGVV